MLHGVYQQVAYKSPLVVLDIDDRSGQSMRLLLSRGGKMVNKYAILINPQGPIGTTVVQCEIALPNGKSGYNLLHAAELPCPYGTEADTRSLHRSARSEER